MQCELPADALALAEDMLARAERILGPDDRIVLALKYDIGYCIYALGDIEDGLDKLDAAAEEAARALGPRSTTTLARRIKTVNLLAEAGRVDAARERLTALGAVISDLPTWHISVSELKKAEELLAGKQNSIGT